MKKNKKTYFCYYNIVIWTNKQNYTGLNRDVN